jgi:hypothetical protein
MGPKIVASRNVGSQLQKDNRPPTSHQFLTPTNGIGHALTDTPLSTAPTSPQLQVPRPQLSRR